MRLAVVLLLACLALAGCGGGDGDDEAGGTTGGGAATTEAGGGAATTGGGGSATDGEAVFASAGCGGCHTLAAAGSSGTQGPNLDELQPDQDTVEEQVRNGGGGMPAFEGKLSDEEIQAVAEYVSSSAGGGRAPYR